jgi:hypothetical protein
MLVEKHLMPNCSQFNCQVFRDTRYWNEECDNIYKAHYPLLENVYNTRSGSHRLPGERKYQHMY